MADLKITELTENTAPLSTDITVMVDDPGGTPATQKVTLANLAALVLSHLKASGANVTTGTSDVTIVTPKAMGDANVNTRLKSKIILIQRDLSTTGADVAYTGVGFQPTAIFAVLVIYGTKNLCYGIADSTGTERAVLIDYAGNTDYSGTYFLFFTTAASQVGRALVKSYDADGFTLTWDKANSPTGTATGYALCFQ